MPEYGAGCLFLEVEQVHDAAKAAMIAFLRFLEHVQVLAQLLVIRPGGAIDALQHLVVGIASPVGTRNVGQLERFTEFSG